MLSFYDLRRNQKNNKILEEQIKFQQSKIDILLEEVNSLKDRDESMRKLLKIPSINDDVRKLGVGGSDSITSLNDLNYLLTNKLDLDWTLEIPDGGYFVWIKMNPRIDAVKFLEFCKYSF